MGFLTGKTAIITGAGRAVLSDGSCGSIGYGIATAYAKEGANLVITGRNEAKLEAAKKELEELYNIKVLPVQADVNAGSDNEVVVAGVVKQAIDDKADKSLYGDTTINVGRHPNTNVGGYSTAEGYYTTARGDYSHAEGYYTIANERFSHAEGNNTTASGQSSHAEGFITTASGDYSHAEGNNTKALHENESACGAYNVSNDDTLFSIGDGTADNARHNAFEITKTGGKLHDKDIATTDLIPTSLPANGGNADMVDGLHADDFVSAAAFNQTQIPSNVDVPAWIHANGKRYQQYMTNGTNIGTTNIPNNSTDYVWYWFDGVNIIAREWAAGKYYICDVINGVFSGWKDVYTSGYKPYVTGDVPISEDGKCYTNHGFTPSVILYNLPYTTATLFDNVQKATTFDTTSFTPRSGAIGAIINYIIFK